MPKTKQTPWELEAQATKIIKDARSPKSDATVAVDLLADLGAIDLLSAQDSLRREARRSNIVKNHAPEIINRLHEIAKSPEKLLIDQELQKSDEQAFRSLLVKVFDIFSEDKLAKRILISVMKNGVSFNSNKRLSETCNMSIPEVKSAKDRIKYRIGTFSKGETLNTLVEIEALGGSNA